MRIARGVQRPFDADGEKQLGALGELLDVEIAAVLARRQGAKAAGRDWPDRRHRAGGIGRKRHAAPRDEIGLALRPRLDLRRRGRDA